MTSGVSGTNSSGGPVQGALMPLSPPPPLPSTCWSRTTVCRQAASDSVKPSQTIERIALVLRARLLDEIRRLPLEAPVGIGAQVAAERIDAAAVTDADQ